MRSALPALLLGAVGALTGCGAASDGDAAPVRTATTPTPYSQEVRGNFLDSCVENAANTAGGAATQEQLTRTCECILGKVEQEYSEAEFADFEERLLGGQASDEESDRLVGWSTDCARASAS